ncbi:AlpA family transcriptional regulator [Parvibaculum sp.]|nr:AlpA family transcriptional regulator [Parvibaculum sp.]
MRVIFRLPEVRRVTGLSRSTIYSLISDEQFPKPVKLGPRAVGWHSAEIAEWIESRRETA